MTKLFIRTILFFTIFCQQCDFSLASLENQENKTPKITVKKAIVRTPSSRRKVILKDTSNLSEEKIEIKKSQKRVLKRKIPRPGQNFPPLPVELAPSSDEFSSTHPYFRPHLDDCAPWMYSGTRQQWAKAKIEYPNIAFSPEKKKKQVSTEYFSPPQEFRIDLDRQGFSRLSYKLLHTGINPLLDYYEACQRQSKKPDLMRAQEIFNDACKHSYDFYCEIDEHHFYVDSSQLNIEASLESLTQKRNPIFKSEFGESSEYHHLFMGHLLALGKEVIILIPSDLHQDHHELLHQFLAPGQKSLARPDVDGLLFSQARQQANQLLLEYLLSKLSE